MSTTYYFFGTFQLGRAKALVFGAALMAALLFGVLAAKPAHAATFTVNSTADTDDTKCESLVPFLNDCTLREAINAANNSSGADTINFNIPGGGLKTIPVSSQLLIREAVVIDGYTQP